MIRQAAIASLALTTSAMAQTERLTLAECRQSWARFAQLIEADPSQSVSARASGLCEVLSVSADRWGGFTIKALRWRGANFSRFIDSGLPPESLRLELDGGAMEVAQLGALFLLSADLAIAWDKRANTVNLSLLDVDLASDMNVSLTALLNDVDLSDHSTMAQTTATPKVKSMRFDVVGAQATHLAIINQLSRLPDDVFVPGAKARLRDAVANPAGALSIDVNTQVGGIAWQTLADAMDGRQSSALDVVEIDIRSPE